MDSMRHSRWAIMVDQIGCYSYVTTHNYLKIGKNQNSQSIY